MQKACLIFVILAIAILSFLCITKCYERHICFNKQKTTLHIYINGLKILFLYLWIIPLLISNPPPVCFFLVLLVLLVVLSSIMRSISLLIKGGEGRVWWRFKSDHMILEQPLNSECLLLTNYNLQLFVMHCYTVLQ